MNNVTITEDQAKIVLQALDITVRQSGLNAAAQVLPIAAVIEQQLTPVAQPEVLDSSAG